MSQIVLGVDLDASGYAPLTTFAGHDEGRRGALALIDVVHAHRTTMIGEVKAKPAEAGFIPVQLLHRDGDPRKEAVSRHLKQVASNGLQGLGNVEAARAQQRASHMLVGDILRVNGGGQGQIQVQIGQEVVYTEPKSVHVYERGSRDSGPNYRNAAREAGKRTSAGVVILSLRVLFCARCAIYASRPARMAGLSLSYAPPITARASRLPHRGRAAPRAHNGQGSGRRCGRFDA